MSLLHFKLIFTSQATEILKSARSIQNQEEQEEYIASALQLCKSVAQNINLYEICREFTFLKAYHAVTDLCVACAKKIDPDNIGVRYYKSNNQVSDQEGHHAFIKRCCFQGYTIFFAVGTYYLIFRMDIYKEVLNMLETVHSQVVQNTMINPVDTSARSEIQNVSSLLDGNHLVRKNLLFCLGTQFNQATLN